MTDSPSQEPVSPQAEDIQRFDVMIAGAGIAGLLAAHKICTTSPNLRVALLEKEPCLGGRMVMGGQSSQYGYGFHSVTPRLYEFWNQALKSDPEADDLPSLVNTRLTRAGILAGNKLTEFDTADLCNERGARALGGLAASRQWSEVNQLMAAENSFDETFADVWKAPRKSPATLVLETYSQGFGITNIWETSPGGIAERASSFTSHMYAGDWQKAFDALVKPLIDRGQLTLHTNARIIDAEFFKEQNTWTVDTAQGSFQASSLIVAQPPWTASQWLPKNFWPSQLATIISKTKPVSAVILSTPVESGDVSDLPQLVFIPAEGVQATISAKEIVFQATIDYEMSVVAPDVVKAVKRLKRAHRKLIAALPELKTGLEHVALMPVSWAQSPTLSERKHLDKLKMNAVQEHHLSFCGDAYGQSLDGDTNLIESVISASEAILS